MFSRELVLSVMEEQGRTRKWLAQKCGIALNSLDQYLSEAAARVPSLPVRKLMAIALECPELDPDHKKPKRAKAS